MPPNEKTRLMAYRTSAVQYVNGRNAVHHYLLPVNTTTDGGTHKAVCVAAAPTASSLSLGVVGSRCQPLSTSSSSLLRRLHRMAASEGNDEPEPYVPMPPPPVSTTMPSIPSRPQSMSPRPVLERQPTAASTTTISGIGEARLLTNSRQPSYQSMADASSTLDALGLRRSVVLYFVSSCAQQPLLFSLSVCFCAVAFGRILTLSFREK